MTFCKRYFVTSRNTTTRIKTRRTVIAVVTQIGQDATFAPTFNGHNSAIFHPILTSGDTKIITLSRQIEWRSNFKN